jgi:hypothetical protein
VVHADLLRRKPRRNAEAMLAPIVQRTLREPHMRSRFRVARLASFDVTSARSMDSMRPGLRDWPGPERPAAQIKRMKPVWRIASLHSYSGCWGLNTYRRN